MKKYLYMLLAVGLCWSGAVLSDDDNPFEDPAEDEDPFAESLKEESEPFREDSDPFADEDDPFSDKDEDPFADVETEGDFNGRYIGKLLEVRIWAQGEEYEGELRFKEEFYPVKGKLQEGVLHCVAGEDFDFTLKSQEEKYLLRSGKFKEELRKEEFPELEEEYEGEKGVKLHIKEKKKTRYTGIVEFKERELTFKGDIRAGVL